MNDRHMNSLSRLFRAFQHPQRFTRTLKAMIEARVLGPMLSVLRQGNIAMFHIGRSGSTVLGNLLNQHPKIFWDGEIYERLLREREKRYSAGVTRNLTNEPIQLLRSRMPRAGKKLYGFETKFFHLKLTNNIELSDYVEQLQGLGFTHFIILERRNYLRKVVSSVIGHSKSRWQQPSHEKAHLTQIELNVDNIKIDRDAKPLISYLEDWNESFRKLEKILDSRKVLRLTYEDDISADPLVGYQRFCDFVGIKHHPVSVRHGKTNPFNLTEMIINFEEVERTLHDTPFKWMLYE